MVFREGEHGNPDVGEDEVLREEVEQLEQLLGSVAWVRRQIVVGVVRLADAAE